VHNYKYVDILQDICLKIIKIDYEEMITMKSAVITKNTNDYNDNDNSQLSDHDINLELISKLKNLTKFEHYNQIDFYSDSHAILKIVKGFIKLGGYCFINIGFDTQTHDKSKSEEQATVVRYSKMINEFKASMKATSNYTLLDFCAQFSDYNDVAFELFDENTPLTWTIGSKNYDNMNLFEFCIDK